MKYKLLAALSFVAYTIAAFFALENKLDIGPKDKHGFTPFDHGFLGYLIKIMLCAGVIVSLYYFWWLTLKNKYWAALATVVITGGLIVGGAMLAFALYYTW